MNLPFLVYGITVSPHAGTQPARHPHPPHPPHPPLHLLTVAAEGIRASSGGHVEDPDHPISRVLQAGPGGSGLRGWVMLGGLVGPVPMFPAKIPGLPEDQGY